MKPLLLAFFALTGACGVRPAASLVPQQVAVVPAADGGSSCSCADFGNPRTAGTLAVPELNELSGLVASLAHPGVLYAHNDSGDSARFFALSTTGVPLSQLVLDGGVHGDWEDIARGPCPTGTCLFLGDIGDNNRVRTDTAIYRVPEPSQLTGGIQGVPFERFAFLYPQGQTHNAETLLADPQTGRLYLVTKEATGTPSIVFRFPHPLDPGVTAVLEQVRVLDLPTPTDAPLTGGDVSPCGDALLLRMYNRLVVLRRAPDAPFEAIFDATPTTVPSASEPQGEAVAFASSGQGYFTASERLVADVTLYESRCR